MQERLKMAIVAALAGAAAAPGAIIYNTPGSLYSENFDSLPNSGSTASWTDNSTLPGWYLVTRATNTPATIRIGAGSDNAGSFYSFGAAGSSERALGGVGSGGTYFDSPPSGQLAGYWGVRIQNNTGYLLTSFTASYVMEQWRDGGATIPAPQDLVAEWAIDPGGWLVGTWTLGASTPSPTYVNTGGGSALDGNASSNRVFVSFTGSSLSWNHGEQLWIRFRELNDPGNDHGLATDDFQFTAVPEPTTAGLVGLAGALAMLRLRRRRVA